MAEKILLLPEKIPHVIGINWRPKQGWHVTVHRDNEQYYIGTFSIKNEAIRALEKAKQLPVLPRVRYAMTREELGIKLFEFVKENGRPPKWAEFNKYDHFIQLYYKNHTNFLNSHGYTSNHKGKKQEYSDEFLFAELQKDIKDRGRIPKYSEFKHKGVVDRFGNWRIFLYKAGVIDEPEAKIPRKWTDEYINEKEKELVKYLIETGKSPTWTTAYDSKIYPQIFIGKYGSWANFKKERLIPALKAEQPNDKD